MGSSTPQLAPAQRDAFFAAAVRGSLTDADRLDLLLRGAAVAWGAASSPAQGVGLAVVPPSGPRARPRAAPWSLHAAVG